MTGRIVSDVNVDNSVAMGEEMLVEFLKGWPDSFNKPLPKCVKTMHATKPGAGINLPKTYYSSAIYTHSHSSCREYSQTNRYHH